MGEPKDLRTDAVQAHPLIRAPLKK